MILSFAIPPGALAALDDAAVSRLSEQFGITPERVRKMAARLDHSVRYARGNLDACQHEGKYAT